MSNKKTQGFTLVEILIIAPIVILIIGAFIGFISSLVGDVLSSRDQSTMVYETQSALNRVEQDTRISTQFLTTTGGLTAPQGSDNNYTGTAAFTNTSNTLLLTALATDQNPQNGSRSLVYYVNQPNACGSTQTHNRALLTTVIYFINGTTLWRRVVVPPWNTNSTVDANTVCSTPWQLNTCSLGYILAQCKTNDEQIMQNISSLSVQYFSTTGSTTDIGAANAGSATAIGVTITSSKNTAGRSVSTNAVLRASKLNNATAAQPVPSSPTVSHSLLSSTSVQFTWTAEANATNYQIGYQINGGAWVTQSIAAGTTQYTVTGNVNDVISFRVAAQNNTGLSLYGTDSATLITISLVASPTTLTSGSATTLTSTTSASVASPSSYTQIYDITTGTWLITCSSGTSCSTPITQSGTTHQFVAYVTRNNSSAYPVSSPQATSNTVSVTWVSPITISLAASPTSLTKGAATTLTSTTSYDVGTTPYYTQIFDATTGTRLTYCSSGTSCSITASQASATTHQYVAYVGTSSTTYPLPSPAATSNTVAVSWLNPWTISLTASPNSTSLNGTVSISATASNDVGPTPYYIEIFDVTTSTFLVACGGGTTCSTTMSQSAATTQRFMAYVTTYTTTYAPGSPVVYSNFAYASWSSTGYTISLGNSQNGNQVTLTGYSSVDVGPTPYYIDLYNAVTGSILAVCGSGTTCTTTVTLSGHADFVAFISDSPANVIQASSNTLSW